MSEKVLDLKLRYIGIDFEFNKNFENLDDTNVETIYKYKSNTVLQELIYRYKLQLLKKKYTEIIYSLETIEISKREELIEKCILVLTKIKLISQEKSKLINDKYIYYFGSTPKITVHRINDRTCVNFYDIFYDTLHVNFLEDL